MSKRHDPDEFNAFFTAAVANEANEAFHQWQLGIDTFARSALQSRRDYINNVRDLHVDGLDGALVPVREHLAADVTHLYIRQAAPTKGRDKQFRARLLSGETRDISPELGKRIFWNSTHHYGGHAHMSDDRPGHAKWLCWKLDGNDLGLLLQEEDNHDRHVVAG